jgi:4-hydroxybenzoate-CoA ligase
MSRGNAVAWFLDRHVAAGRGDAAAFTDPHRGLTYAALAEASARFAGGLRAAGIGRERRLLMLMLDTVDFPVAFWGALRAGVVPVPVNTLLTAEQVAYMLEDSRAEAVILSAPLLPALGPVVAASPWPRLVLVAAPDGAPMVGLASRRTGPPALPRRSAAAREPVAADPDEVAFWLYSSGSTGAPKGTKHVHASLRATAETYAAQVLGIRPDDTVYSAAKLFFAYGLGNAMTFPMSVGAQAVLLPDRPSPDAVLSVMARHRPTLFCGVPTLYAALLAHRGSAAAPARIGCASASRPARLCLSMWGCAGESWAPTSWTASAPRRCCTSSSPTAPGRHPLRHHRARRAGLRPADRGRAGTRRADGEIGELLVRGPSAAEGTGTSATSPAAPSRANGPAPATSTSDADGDYRYQGPRGRHVQGERDLGLALRGGGGAAGAPAVQEAAVVGRARMRTGLVPSPWPSWC